MVEEIDVAELETLLGQGATLVDVRMSDEFESERVPGAVLIPLPELPARFGEIPNEGRVLVICRSGGRSLQACEFLAKNGYDALNVAGGTMAWVESGRTVESGPFPG